MCAARLGMVPYPPWGDSVGSRADRPSTAIHPGVCKQDTRSVTGLSHRSPCFAHRIFRLQVLPPGQEEGVWVGQALAFREGLSACWERVHCPGRPSTSPQNNSNTQKKPPKQD